MLADTGLQTLPMWVQTGGPHGTWESMRDDEVAS